VKEKLRVRLMNSGRFTVVETSEKADAVLLGSAGVDKTVDRKGTDYTGTGLLRLVERVSERTIWAHEYERSYCFSCFSISSKVADQMADALLASVATSPTPSMP
jgi:hypothetical protein